MEKNHNLLEKIRGIQSGGIKKGEEITSFDGKKCWITWGLP